MYYLRNILNKKKYANYQIASPCDGIAHSLVESSDPVFAKGSLGPGCFIVPQDNNIYSPISGKVKMVFPTKHAIGLVTDKGIEVMIHIGIDTVNLKGKFFTTSIHIGDEVKVGEKIITADFQAIDKAGYKTDVYVILTNIGHKTIVFKYGGVKHGSTLITLSDNEVTKYGLSL